MYQTLNTNFAYLNVTQKEYTRENYLEKRKPEGKGDGKSEKEELGFKNAQIL